MKLTPDQIKNAVCKYYEISPDIYTNKRRFGEVVNARHVCIYMIRKNIPKTRLLDVARMFNLSNHATVIYIENKIAELSTVEKKLVRELREIQYAIDMLLIPEGKDFIDYCLLGKSIN